MGSIPITIKALYLFCVVDQIDFSIRNMARMVDSS
jgi:hypothetical protein